MNQALLSALHSEEPGEGGAISINPTAQLWKLRCKRPRNWPMAVWKVKELPLNLLPGHRVRVHLPQGQEARASVCSLLRGPSSPVALPERHISWHPGA